MARVVTEAEVRGCLAASYLDSVASLEVPSVAYGLKYADLSALQCIYLNGAEQTLEYLPDDPTSEPGEPWLLKKEQGESICPE